MRRKRAPKITYRTLKAEIRALLDRPGVVEDAEERIIDWLIERQRQRLKAAQDLSPGYPVSWHPSISANELRERMKTEEMKQEREISEKLVGRWLEIK